MATQFETYFADACRATPAAIARILLGMKSEPAVAAIAAVWQKVIAIIGSVCFAITAGEIARSFQSTSPYASLIVIAVAFNAQHLAARTIALSTPAINLLEKEARKRLKERNNDK